MAANALPLARPPALGLRVGGWARGGAHAPHTAAPAGWLQGGEKGLLAMVANNDSIKNLTRCDFISIPPLMKELKDISCGKLIAQVTCALRFMPYPNATADITNILITINDHLRVLEKNCRGDEAVLSLKEWGKCIGSIRHLNSDHNGVRALLAFAVRDLEVSLIVAAAALAAAAAATWPRRTPPTPCMACVT
jgi:hypothetical protein